MLKRLLALLLALSMVFCLFACDAGSSDKDKDEDEEEISDKDQDEEGDKDTDEDEGEEITGVPYTVSGLTFYAPEAYALTYDQDDYIQLDPDYACVTAIYMETDSYTSSEDYATFMATCSDDIVVCEENGVFYTLEQKAGSQIATLVAYYVDGSRTWTIEAQVDGFDTYGQEIIGIITGGVID